MIAVAVTLLALPIALGLVVTLLGRRGPVERYTISTRDLPNVAPAWDDDVTPAVTRPATVTALARRVEPAERAA